MEIIGVSFSLFDLETRFSLFRRGVCRNSTKLLFFFSNLGEANKMTNDLRYKLKKAEAEIQALSASVARLDTQVVRYKAIAEEAEGEAERQKTDKRKAQREVRSYCLYF